jgi:predicted metal-dependent peptidase
MSFDFDHIVIKLINSNEFYAHLLMQFKFEFTTNDKVVPTAGVTIRNSSPLMIMNTKWMGEKTLDAQCLIIIHELAHFILGHLGERGSQYSKEDKMCANIAKDAAIHEIVTEIKKNKELKDCVTVEKLRTELKNDDIKSNETSEYYFNFIKQANDKIKQKLSEMLLDEHIFDNDGEEFDSDEAKGILGTLLSEALRKTKEGAGDVPAYAELELSKLKQSKTNWKAQLRRFMGSNTDVDKRVTRNRMNRRYQELGVPGKRKKFEPHVVLIIDTSGSMCGDPLEQAFAELDKMNKQGYDITVIEADTEVKKTYKYDRKKFKNFTGGGGTMYQPSITYAKKLNPDVILFLGDMDSADAPVDPKVPFMWVIIGESEPPGNFGRKIKVEV